ncbi:SSUH2-like protein [Mya arenaria]|uniref:SSUH2-like protein n=1 Tax=Mya arenaria TaxID=6604 RepID=A0ABY7FWB6_MYAAR|nr:protein SSUH2 homolog [Mya arenaria]WAR25347.1 SSUH2-like protein [Mya arenaria]
MSAYPPGGFDPNQAPQRWQPGMGGPAPQNPNMPQNDMEGTQPPQGSYGDPAYPPIQGYEGVKFGSMMPMPPPPMPQQPQGDPPPQTFTDMANLTEEDCRQAMIQFVSENCCYGSKPAKEMKITKFTGITAMHYVLETFAEGRSTGSANEPYRGGPIDGPQNGMAPPPWSIPCQPHQTFHDHDIKIEVPHTSVVSPCQACEARGWNYCWRCSGRGRNRCNSCGGDGKRMEYDAHRQQHVRRTCHHCHGDGRVRCHTCGGDGRITCDTCDGFRMLRCFILLTVRYTNHKDDYILETSDMPDELVRTVGGTVLFEDTQPMVWPIQSYPVPEVNQNSQRLVSSHRSNWPSEKKLSQRQTLRGVPVTEVAYTWDDQHLRYWVYGRERRVHSPDYPQQCCCGCSIL